MKFLKWLHEQLKWLVAGKEMQELEDRRLQSSICRQVFAEFADIKIVLENMEFEVQGKECFIHWVLRDKLREIRDRRHKKGNSE